GEEIRSVPISPPAPPPTPDNQLKFTGQMRDAETGMDYFSTRYYGSPLGRFMSPDYVFNDSRPGSPQSWNLYAYARNNPLRFIDPTGEALIAYDQAGKFLCSDTGCFFDDKGNLTVGDRTYNTAEFELIETNPQVTVSAQIPKNYPLIEPG